MTFEADQIVDRRRLRRKLSFWRVVAFLALVVAIVGGYVLFAGRDAIPELATPQIARITLDGFITDNHARNELIERVTENDSVKAVVVAIDSTGGVTAGGEALYEGLRRLAETKPTVATVGTFAASAAYMAAIATDHIVARRTSITGSIGVLFQYPQISELMDKIGVHVETVKSAPLKAEPSPFNPTSEDARRMMAGVVQDTYDWFVDIVAERRDMARPRARALADGRIFTGRQALDADLIDAIGGEEEAIAWLERERGVEAGLPVRDWEASGRGAGFFSYTDALILWLGERAGISPDLLHGGVLDRFLPERLKLDGLISVWQAPSPGYRDPEGAAQ